MSAFENNPSQYFEEAGDWGYDKYHSIKRRNRYLWIGLVFSWSITLAAVLAVKGLTPLKENTPFLIERNPETGETTQPKRITSDTFDGDWLVDQSFIMKYFQARERFVSEKRFKKEDYKMVQVLSSREAKKRWVDFVAESKDSPKKLFAKGDTREVRVKAATKLPDGTVQIHWSSVDYIDGERQEPEHWISTLNYGYSEEAIPESKKWRYENLVGFMVTNYSREPTTITGWE